MGDTEGALTLEQERTLRIFYIRKLQTLGDKLKYPKVVTVSPTNENPRSHLTPKGLLIRSQRSISSNASSLPTRCSCGIPRSYCKPLLPSVREALHRQGGVRALGG
jgi:hypothetical protein